MAKNMELNCNTYLVSHKCFGVNHISFYIKCGIA
jgi:hypothetical protein